MSKNLHNIDKFFKDRIERFEDEPSSNVWNEIDKQLDKKQVVSISKSYYKLKLAAALLLLVSFGMAMYIFQMRKNNNELVEKNNIEIPLKTNTEVTKENVKALNQPDTANDSEKDKDNFLKKTPMSVDTSNQNEQFTENEDEEAIGILTEKSNKQSWKKIDLAEKVRRKIKFVNSEDKNEPIVKSIEKIRPQKLLIKRIKSSGRNWLAATALIINILLLFRYYSQRPKSNDSNYLRYLFSIMKPSCQRQFQAIFR
jgi:hypothetical protein